MYIVSNEDPDSGEKGGKKRLRKDTPGPRKNQVLAIQEDKGKFEWVEEERIIDSGSVETMCAREHIDSEDIG